MRLCNVVREESRHDGVIGWRLRGPDGNYIRAFDQFSYDIRQQAYRTRKRYCEVVSQFIDYLYEVGIIGGDHVTRSQVNTAIDLYLQLLRDGEDITIYETPSALPEEKADAQRRQAALRQTAKRLEIKPLAAQSWSNTIAPLNRFLRVCAMLQEEAHEIALMRAKVDPTIVQAATFDSRPLIEALENSTTFSRHEVSAIKLASAIGAVIRFRGSELSRPGGLKGPKLKKKQKDTQVFDFPMEHFERLLASTNSWRNRALWLLLAASGIRISEALNVEWHHIDFENQIVYVLDPAYLRYGKQLSERDRLDRFKGRVVSWTYLRMPYRQQFFEVLQEYRKHEYVLPRDDKDDFVFQYDDGENRGKPYREASDSALAKAFKKALKKAEVPGPPMNPLYEWTLHSLRHAYGVYMLNDFPVPGQVLPGLRETEVQMLMGHSKITSTRKYARTREDRLKQKLALHDHLLLGYEVTEDFASLPAPFVERLRLQYEQFNEVANG